MPPQPPLHTANENRDQPVVGSSSPSDGSNPLLPRGQKPSSGPIVGVVIIVVLMMIGALYFWGARLNQQENPQDLLPLTPPDSSTTTLQ